MPGMKPTRDHAFRAQLARVEARPILIMGLHRSGTTWLYEALASVLPVATLCVYDIVHYGELLAAHEDGSAPALRRAIDARLGGAATRGFDEIELSHATLDEYGFVLRRHAGQALVNARTLPTFDDLTRKLALLARRPDVLLKNPWDSRQGAFLAQHVPAAKFIFLRRTPVRILDSQMRMVDGFLAGENPLLELLMEGLEPEGAIYAAARATRRLAGVERFRRFLARVMEKHVRDEIGRLRASFAAVPPARRIELDYDEMVADPAGGLERVVRFVQLSPTRPLTTVKATPRGRELLPAVAARAESLRAALTA
jgi:hypothetical protein